MSFIPGNLFPPLSSEPSHGVTISSNFKNRSINTTSTVTNSKINRLLANETINDWGIVLSIKRLINRILSIPTEKTQGCKNIRDAINNNAKEAINDLKNKNSNNFNTRIELIEKSIGEFYNYADELPDKFNTQTFLEGILDHHLSKLDTKTLCSLIPTQAEDIKNYNTPELGLLANRTRILLEKRNVLSEKESLDRKMFEQQCASPFQESQTKGNHEDLGTGAFNTVRKHNYIPGTLSKNKSTQSLNNELEHQVKALKTIPANEVEKASHLYEALFAGIMSTEEFQEIPGSEGRYKRIGVIIDSKNQQPITTPLLISLDRRNCAIYRFSELFHDTIVKNTLNENNQSTGSSVIVQTLPAMNNGKRSIVMDLCKSAETHQPDGSTLCFDDLAEIKTKITLEQFNQLMSDPAFQRAAMELQCIDAILGSIDRHSGNVAVEFKIDADKKIHFISLKGIDNDWCLGEKKVPTYSDTNIRQFYCGLPPVIDTAMSKTVLSLTKASFQENWGKEYATQKELDVAWSRIEQFQEAIKDTIVQVIDPDQWGTNLITKELTANKSRSAIKKRINDYPEGTPLDILEADDLGQRSYINQWGKSPIL
jgi:hypothetical protein